MPLPPSNPRSQPQVDPCPGFRALVDLPYRFALEVHQTSTLGDLAAGARDAASPESWVALYARSLLEGERILNSIDQKLDAQQQALNSLDDPMEVRNRMAGAPRRGAERTVTELRTALQRCAKEWLDRTRRQQEFIIDESAPWFRDMFRWNERPAEQGVHVHLDPVWWSQLERFTLDACTRWQASVVQGFDAVCQETVQHGLRDAQPPSTSLPSPPPPNPVPDARLKLDTPVEERLVEVPKAWRLIFNSAKSSLMAIGWIASLIASPMLIAFGLSGRRSPGLAIAGGVASFVVFCVMIYFSRDDAAHELRLRKERGIEGWRATAVQQMRAAVGVVLDRQHRALDRWIESRTEQWTRSVDTWFSADVEPRFTDADARAQEQVRLLKLQQARMQEELSTLRSLRGQFSQTILPELRRRHHELAHAVATVPKPTGDSG